MTDIKYYSYDNDDGFEEYETEEQAKAAADELMSCRDEFDEDDEIEYGVMIPLGRLTETNRRDTPENQEEADWWETNKWAYVCDHEIATVTTLNHALANEYVKLRTQLAEANRTIEALRNEPSKCREAWRDGYEAGGHDLELGEHGMTPNPYNRKHARVFKRHGHHLRHVNRRGASMLLRRNRRGVRGLPGGHN